MRSNCLVEAAREWFRLRSEWIAAGRPSGRRPYVWIRSSMLAPEWVPHFGVAQHASGRWVMRSFKPLSTAKLRWWQLWKVVIFVGHWVEGDEV